MFIIWDMLVGRWTVSSPVVNMLKVEEMGKHEDIYKGQIIMAR